ncbi:MAG: SDR family oxidoreductase [Lachnospiraceae bacterium]|nr:SDR family oxidoreductase [Lachnospiraceae bacterium]
MDLHLDGKVVVITGGSQGIGKAAGLAFAKEGCVVCACARRQERLDQAREEFQARGFELFTQKTDVTKPEELEAFADAVMEKYGRIDIWINNAGVNQYKKLLDYDYEDLMRIINTNLTAVIVGGKIAAERMKETGGGVILNCSSFAAVAPMAGKAPYAACKSGVLSLTRTMAAEFAAYHIRVNAYIPGGVNTEINKANVERYGDKLLQDIPMQRFGEPEEIAQAMIFLASDAAGYINGTALEITGGKRCTQNPLFSYEAD